MTYSPPLVEADVERELDDQRHELFRNEVREFRHEGREEFCAVRFFVGFPAARGLDFPQVGVRAMPGVILKDICCPSVVEDVIPMILAVQGNLANLYDAVGRCEQALQLRRDVYSGYLRLYGEEHEATLHAANNYAGSLRILKRFEEAKSLLRTTLLVVRRVLGESELMLWMRWTYARALYENPSCTLDEAREAVTTLEDVERTSRRVLGGAHPFTKTIERHLRALRAALRARETGGAREPVTTAN